MKNNELRFKKDPYLVKLDRIMGTSPPDSPSMLYLFPDQLSGGWIVLSILATPYILWLLFKLKRYGWLISFSLFIIAPFLIGFSFIEDGLFRMALTYLPLLNLGVFHFLLKQSYPEWKEPVFSNTPGSDYHNG